MGSSASKSIIEQSGSGSYYAARIGTAIKTKDKKSLIEILACRSNAEKEEIKTAYEGLFKKELEKDLDNSFLGDIKKLLLSLVTVIRDESCTTDEKYINEDARTLYDFQTKGTDMDKCITIMTQKNFHHLQKVFQIYMKYSQMESVDKKVKGDLKESFLMLGQCIDNTELNFATSMDQTDG
ncbi:annexin A2-A-like [Danio aesculapii]|uniref:annexin A2-A-like n=1 Tax=Danio aesculapii TaxID=1142201 RepID=UPI0024BF1C93|nr:annexin A2-A-like [Danio aesculapii]